MCCPRESVVVVCRRETVGKRLCDASTLIREAKKKGAESECVGEETKMKGDWGQNGVEMDLYEKARVLSP